MSHPLLAGISTSPNPSHLLLKNLRFEIAVLPQLQGTIEQLNN
jgi:hypothetical protein